MSCLSLGFLQALIVQCIIIGVVIAVIQLLVPMLVSLTGWPVIGQILMIILWGIIAIMIVYIIFALLSFTDEAPPSIWQGMLKKKCPSNL